MTPKTIFLSHSSKDRVKATRIAEVLRKNKLSVWFSVTNIKGAQQWHDAIGRALKRCDWFIVLVSKDAIKSTWVKQELMYALNHRQYKEHILPIIIGDCNPEELSWTMKNFQSINMRQMNGRSYKRLLNTWGIKYNP